MVVIFASILRDIIRAIPDCRRHRNSVFFVLTVPRKIELPSTHHLPFHSNIGARGGRLLLNDFRALCCGVAGVNPREGILLLLVRAPV